MRKLSMLAPVVALGLVLAACATDASDGTSSHSTGHEAAPAVTKTSSTVQLHEAMRKLWEDHVTWTRLYIVSAAAGLGDQKVTAERLLRNQDDIGNAIKPFYGEAAGEALTKLLREHILGAADLLTAAKAGDNPKVEKLTAAWYVNGDQIAAFLAKANPENWPLAAVKHHMRTHLDLTLQEAVARLQGRFAEDVALYDKVHDAILEMSDALADGIVAQFPDRFST